MNYWHRYPGDYARDTTMLTLAEHGAYSLLLDTYYATEKPLPADHGPSLRICRAVTDEERAAVLSVLEQFFPVGADGLRHNKRADKVIAEARPRIEAAKANGAKGGKKKGPLGNPSANPLGNPLGNPGQTQRVAQPASSPAPAPAPTPSAPEDGKTDVFLATGDKQPDGQQPLPGLPPAPGQERADKAEPQRRSFTAGQLMAAFADAFPDSPAPEKWTPARDKTLRARLKEDDALRDLGWWIDTFDWIRKNCDFLMGKVEPRPGQKRFVLTFDWLINPTNLANILEGKYHNELRRK